MSVGKICSREVHVAAPDEHVLGLARRMSERGMGTLVVLDEDRQPIGIVTDRDLVVRVLAGRRDPGRTPVAEIMTREPRVVHESAPIESALATMKAAAVRRLPVIDDAGRLVGILSLDDVLGLLAEELVHIGGVIERQGPVRAPLGKPGIRP